MRRKSISSMKIIPSHERTDMDALASMCAAALLYPEHQAVLPQNLNRNLRDFLALYRDEMPFSDRRNLPHRRISEVILVDTQSIAPLRGMNAQTRLHVIDHHLPEETLGENVTFEGEPVGATTTLLVERIRAHHITLSKVGATLLLLGIYEDTGSLSFQTTTARDAQASAWLLEMGADVSLVHDFLRHPLSQDQRETLAKLISQSTVHTVRGRSICIAAIVLDRYVDELSSLIHPLDDVYQADACFLMAQYEDSIQIIARSNTDAIK